MRERKLATWMMEGKARFKDQQINFSKLLEKWQNKQRDVQDCINEVEPDLIIVENLFNLPFIMSMKYKWAFVVSTNPLKIANQIDFPPVGSGTCENWEWYTETVENYNIGFRDKLDNWYREFGLERKPSLSHIQPSPYFNVCLYPKPLNYFNAETGDIDGNWLQLSSTIVKDEVNKFIQDQGWVCEKKLGKHEFLTKEFLDKPGKLILFSLGTLVSECVELYKKILPAIENSPHKFIVSKGKNGDQFELPANCIGSKDFNQLELLPLVDVFFTHG